MAKRIILAAALLCAGAATAAPITYKLPEETAELKPGPHLDVVQANCGGCHSADYVSTQPRPLPNPTAFWTAEVTKMVKVYKAPIEDANVPGIVEYLASTYGK